MRLTSSDGIRLRPIDSRGVDAIYKKLAAYEDAEEQGLLVRLPCKVGTAMYEDQVKQLRELASIPEHCKNVDTCDKCSKEDICLSFTSEMIIEVATQAADAIEKLNRIIYLLESDRDAERELRLYAERKIPRWIPVTETPPRKVGDDGYNGYLIYGIYDGNGYYEVADYTTDKFDNVPYFHVDGEYEPDVTHYMPLPEPPKE